MQKNRGGNRKLLVNVEICLREFHGATSRETAVYHDALLLHFPANMLRHCDVRGTCKNAISVPKARASVFDDRIGFCCRFSVKLMLPRRLNFCKRIQFLAFGLCILLRVYQSNTFLQTSVRNNICSLTCITSSPEDGHRSGPKHVMEVIIHIKLQILLRTEVCKKCLIEYSSLNYEAQNLQLL
jgi:hypothetical protein